MTDFVVGEQLCTDEPIPVTLLSGFLGAGKTTLLMDILRNKQNLRCAIIVNDMSSLNIDAAIVNKSEILQRKEEMVEMQNGCICCTLRGDLLKEITGLAKSKKFDYLIIESTGISEPMQVAETFVAPAEMLIEDGKEKDGLESLVGIARLDTCVTVVDAANFFEYMENTKLLNEGLPDAEDDDSQRTIANLLVEQVEFANTVIVNKINLVTEKVLTRLKGLISKLNPSADIITTNFSKVPLTKVLNTGKFDMEIAKEAPGWLDSLTNGHTPETEEYGISSFVYNAARPFHAERLFMLLCKYFFLLETGYEPQFEEGNENSSPAEAETEATDEQKNEEPNENTEDEIHKEKEDEENRKKHIAARASSHWRGLMRSKGYFWLATRPDQLGSWAQAGGMLAIDCAGTLDDEEVDEDDDKEEKQDRPEVKAKEEQESTNKTQQQLVFIGSFVGEDKTLLEKDLDSCLLSDAEMALFEDGNLSEFEDPWETWPPVDGEDDDHDHDNDESCPLNNGSCPLIELKSEKEKDCHDEVDVEQRVTRKRSRGL